MLYSYFLDDIQNNPSQFIHATITQGTTIHLVMVHETQCAEGNRIALETYIHL